MVPISSRSANPAAFCLPYARLAGGVGPRSGLRKTDLVSDAFPEGPSGLIEREVLPQVIDELLVAL